MPLRALPCIARCHCGTWIILMIVNNTHSSGKRGRITGSVGERGPRGLIPWWGVGGEADEVSVFKTLIFQCFCYSFAWNDVLFNLFLSCSIYCTR